MLQIVQHRNISAFIMKLCIKSKSDAHCSVPFPDKIHVLHKYITSGAVCHSTCGIKFEKRMSPEIPGTQFVEKPVQDSLKKSSAAACTSRSREFLWRKIPFSERKIASLQISRPESEGFK